MTFRTSTLPLVALVVLALSGCSAAVGADNASTGTGGNFEMAVTEICAEADDPQCVMVNGQSVVVPDVFQAAGVEDAAVADSDGQNAVTVTFDEEGAVVLQALTTETAEAGTDARLLIRIGGELQAAVTVLEPLDGAEAQIGLAPDEDAQEFVDRILQG
jgi:hypothetical protein